MSNEPGALVLNLLGNLIDRIKSSQPLRTDGKALTTGFVYSQLLLGMPVDPRDYSNPWSPMGGSTLQDTVAAAGAPAAPGGGAAPAPGGSPAGGSPAKPAPDPKFARAMEAAFKTSQLVDNMIMVTDDDTFVEYPTTRHVSFAYEGVIAAMQPLPMPPISPDIQKQIDSARKVLYQLDDQGNIIGKSPLYKNYVSNALAYAQAKKNFADGQAAALADPTKADAWPQDSVFLQEQVNTAWDTFKTEGAEQVERALDTIESVGVSIQDHEIAKARQVYDAWNLGLAGVPVATPYSYISPTNWCDPTDDQGWEQLHISQSEYQSNAYSHFGGNSAFHSQDSGSSTTAGGALFLGFIGVAGQGGASSADSSWNSQWHYDSSTGFSNSATGLTIDLEYALCTINRPWLIGDLFYLQNWYLVNAAKNAISNGKIDGQIRDEKPLLPMTPTAFLAIRNVTITATDWGSDGEAISNMMSSAQGSSSGSSASGGGGLSLGFINFGGSHSEYHNQADTSSEWTNDGSSHYGTYWHDQTLRINGTQIVAWLSEITPSSPPLDDPGLKK